jgi:DNA polymerase
VSTVLNCVIKQLWIICVTNCTPRRIGSLLIEGRATMLDTLPHRNSRTARCRDTGITHVFFRDYETRSRVSLLKLGASLYAAHPSTEVLLAAFCVDDGPMKLWRRGEPVPPEFLEAEINSRWCACAHNDAFESAIEEHVLHPRFGFPIIPPGRHCCTQAMALAAGLPAGLGAAADALELEHRKDRHGERLMHRMNKPRRPRKGEDPNQIYWVEGDDDLRLLGKYVTRDTEATREFHYRLPLLSPKEQKLWRLDSLINRRGFCIDRELAEAACQTALAAASEINEELARLTDGAVTSINQVARLTEFLRSQGCSLKSLNRKAVDRQLEKDNLPPSVARVLELRRGGASAAIKKFDALLARAGSDDRVRGAFRYHGAATGRWSGVGFQPQNMKRPQVEDINAAIEAVKTGDYQHVKTLFPRQTLSVVADCIRPTVIAGFGHKLFGGDFSSIESRGLAWVVDEKWKLDSYRRYDATRDARDEPYCVTACKIYRKPPGSFTKDSPERAVGKICDLAFGYQGGRGAWRNFDPSNQFTDVEAENFKLAWRAQHLATCKFWHEINNATVLALRNPGEVVRCGRIDLKYTGAFLLIKLPSGRKLHYPQPRLIIVKDKSGRDRACVSFKDNAAGQFKDCRNGLGAYGGLWTENIVSGIARDLLAAAMLRLEAAGYAVVLHVHDEIVSEVPEGFGSIDEFTRLMIRKPAWALDLPIAASAWTGPRYCK